ncbi:MAG: S-layer homology domain-containing protein [Clostridia bacterium]|nr:S-layer homology domain-containing protein [Clostridia bacterium]
MKRVLIAFMVFLILSQSALVYAIPTEFSGGVNNEFEYSEYVFLTGEPVKFTGTCKITETVSKDKKTVSYRIILSPEDKKLEGKLDRNMSYITTYTKYSEKGQTTSQTTVGTVKETIAVGANRYELKNYQFYKSNVIDNRPVADYYNGNIKGKKQYSINTDEGTATIDISGGDVGYENFWGNTDTQLIDYVITVNKKGSGANASNESWQGTVKVQVSDSGTKQLRYSRNEAGYSSFDGGYMKIINREMVSTYRYDLPEIKGGKPDANKRKQGSVELSQSMLPKLERLVVPKFRDIGGHWAEDYISKLYSLEVFADTKEFFQPDVAMTRSEFIKGVMQACNIRPNIDQKKTVSTSKKKTAETPVFKDLKTTDPNYAYIKDAVEKGIISGMTPELFKPNDPLKRGQAITILIRALGFENKAPTPGFATSFADDSHIPGWAKDCVYVARELGLVQGDSSNRFNSEAVLTRAEASALLVRFLEFLQKDLQKDYRENILLYN